MSGSSRAPIFYDSNDTTYYVDPNSTTAAILAGSVGVGSTSPVNTAWGTAASTKQMTIYGSDYGVLNLRGNLNTAAHYSLGVGNNRYYAAYDNVAAVHRIVFFGDYTGFNGIVSPSYNIHLSGTGYATGDWRAPLFYDSNNTAYYEDFASTSNVNQINMQGVLRRNASAAGYMEGNYPSSTDSNSSCAIYTIGGSYQPTNTTLGNMYGVGYTLGNGTANPGLGQTGWGFYVASNGTSRIFLDSDSGVGIASGSLRAPIFYDYNNTSYYLDPASTSQLSYVLADNWFRAQGSTGLYFQTYAMGLWPVQATSGSYGNVATYGSGYNGWNGYNLGGQWTLMNSGNGDNIGVHSNVYSWLWYWDGSSTQWSRGYTQFAGSARAPIFYDSDNTGYYANLYGTTYCYYLQSATTIQADSDRRIKDNIKTIENGLDKVLRLRGATFTRTDLEDKNKKYIGLIAQEVLEVIPEVVGGTEDTSYSVSYGEIVAVLIEAIKEQQKQIEELREIINGQ
jgi:hypothetical protein